MGRGYSFEEKNSFDEVKSFYERFVLFKCNYVTIPTKMGQVYREYGEDNRFHREHRLVHL